MYMHHSKMPMKVPQHALRSLCPRDVVHFLEIVELAHKLLNLAEHAPIRGIQHWPLITLNIYLDRATLVVSKRLGRSETVIVAAGHGSESLAMKVHVLVRVGRCGNRVIELMNDETSFRQSNLPSHLGTDP